MFGTNKITGRSYFEPNKADGTLIVTSIFTTLQGEGPYSGRPAIFVRLSYCNLQCGFCDSFFDYGDKFTIKQLIDDLMARAVKLYPDAPHKVGVVFTGGEPSLQTNVVNVINRIMPMFHFVQIESNGLLLLEHMTDGATLVVSPKCSEKNGAPTRYFETNKRVLERTDCLKFVMSADTVKYMPYSEVPDWALAWRDATGKDIYVSPMNMYNRLPEKAQRLREGGTIPDFELRSTVDEVISFWEPGLLDNQQNQHNHEYTARYALKYGLTLSLQQHLYASMA